VPGDGCGHPVVGGEPPRRGADRGQPVGAEQRKLRRHRRGHLAGQAGGGGVDHVPCHQPVGGELAAGDGHQSGQRGVHHVLTGQLGRRLLPVLVARAGLAPLVGGRLGDERAQAGVDGEHVAAGQRPGEHPVGLAEYVVDVLGRGGGLGPVARPVGVGGADDPAGVPRDEEQHALARPDDHPGVRVDGGPRHHQVHALGHPHLVAGPHPARLVHQVRPDAGAHDHPGGAHVEGPAALLVKHAGPRHPRAVAEQRGGGGPGDHGGAVPGGRPRHGDRVPGVVHLSVVVHHRARQPVGPQRGRAAQCPPRGQVPVMRNGALHPLHRVVDHQPRADVWSFHDLLVQRVHERDRPHQVRCQPAHQQVALPQCLPDELEVALFQVPQAAVNELGRPRRGTRRQVPGLDKADPQAPRRRVERGAGPGDTAADDQHVERPGRQRADGLLAVTCVKYCGHGRQPPPGPPGGSLCGHIVFTGIYLVTNRPRNLR
jgi:hypothetical protein